jgi:glycosyltransferase involved in cell wall biosynthesis
MAALRILHVTPYSADAWAYGGIPRVARSLTVGLARQGHQVTVATTDACDRSARLAPKEHPHRTPRRAWPPYASEGVDVRVFPNISNRLAYDWQCFLPLGLRRFLRDEAGGFDVAHLHACRNVPGALAAHYLQRAGVPYVLGPNGTAPNIERRRLTKRAFDRIAGDRVMAGASRVIAVSRAEERSLHDLGVTDERIRVIPNPLDLEEFDPQVPTGRFRRRLGLSDEPLVLFLGKLTPRKRVDLLVRAFAMIRDSRARLVVAGNDMGAGRGVRALVRALTLERRARFTGLLRGGDRLEALADASVVVYPSEHEAFGLVPLEALLAGTPVIVADDSGCGEIIAAVDGGHVVSASAIEPLARAIDDVLADQAAWRQRAARAAHRVRERFGAPIVCSALAQLYADVATDA